MAIAVVTTLNPLEENITFQKTPVSNKFYSSKLLNYVESVEIGGFRKTVFYTELNTNLNVGDRVFIVNGNYDSNNFISIDKYTKYTDGYRVLGCDGCRLILDLDYTGELPYIADNQDNSIKVYHVRSQREFDYINSITVNHQGISFRDDLGLNRVYFGAANRMSKFCGRRDVLGATPSEFTAVLCTDSIIYVDKPWQDSTLIHNRNTGVNAKGFFVRDDVSNSTNPSWINVTSEIFNNKIKIVNNNIYSNVQTNLYINGEDFTFNSVEFKQRNTYRYLDSTWKLDVRYKVPYVSRLNFRFGRFNGEHKDGIFGTNLRRNNWRSAVWTSGTFLNSIWNSGAMNSKSTSGEKSYYATYEDRSIPPVQTIDFSNNRGYGYNLIEDSIIVSGVIQNGNFENCNLGRGTTFSALNVYFGQTYSYDLKLGGLYSRCDLNGVTSERAKFKNSNIINSSLLSSNLVNSQIYRSTANSSTFTDEEGINVLAADMWGYTYDTSSETGIRGILKLYISDSDARKVNISDSFYLTKINKNLFLTNLTNDEKIKLPIETKFLFDIYSDFELDNNKIVVTFKNKNDNKTKSIVRRRTSVSASLDFSNSFTRNTVEYSSIDIECNAFGWYEGLSLSTAQTIGGNSGTTLASAGGLSTTQTTNQILYVQNYGLSPITPRNANLFFTGTYIRNADFRNGYFDRSTWISGANINYKHHVIPFDGNNNLNIITVATDTLYVGLEQNRLNQNIAIFGEDLSVGDIVWLNSIDHVVGSNVKSIDGRYRVQSIVNGTFREVYLKSLTGLTFSGSAVYRTSQSQRANYSSIHKFQINNSTINSGLLCRTSVKNSTIVNSEFNNFDKNLDILNIERLRLINMLFKDTKNNIKSGYIHKSHIINDTWTSGIVFNSIWNGAVFQDGVFNAGYWQSGLFKNGSFINSRDVATSLQSYDNSTNLYRNWLNGTFENGEFFNSVWSKGTFKNGRFYNSEWYTGLWENGILGSKSLRTFDTKFGYSSPIPTLTATNSIWRDGIVENAIVGGSGSVYWQNGKFNDGDFTSFGQISTNESIWYDGQFNNGKFSGLARWKNGKFFKGKFHSHYGYTLVSPTNPSTYSTSYGWENGKFLGGEFGTADLGTNSVWHGGEFSGGIFQGRFWYNGLFTNGNFLGSGTASLIYSSNISNLGEYEFANSFRSRYYGLWYNGNVSDNPKNIKTEERVSTELSRKVEEERVSTIANLQNILWINGTFSHKGGTIQNSLWLKGNFYDGIFDSSIFNPYIDRTFSGLPVSTFASTSSCIWYNGTFESTLGTGSFYVSNWERGTFNKGYMSGAVWKNGVWNYGFADNIVWLNGLWRNGNWNSAPFSVNDLDETTSPISFMDGRAKDIVLSVSRTLNVDGIYLNNVFSASTGVPILTDPTITSVNLNTSSVTFDPLEIYFYETFSRDPNDNSLVGDLASYQTSEWIDSTTITTQTGQISNTNVTTTGGTSPISGIEAESSRLYACLPNLNKNVFTLANRSYVITLQLTVQRAERVDVFIKVGNKDEFKSTLFSNAVNVNGRITYFPKQYTFRFIYSTPTVVSPDDTQFYIKKGLGGLVSVLYLEIEQKDYIYHPTLNNSLVNNSINGNDVFLPSPTEISFQAISTDGNLVTANIGNGIFKSGIWENGVWNNGYRSNEFVSEKDYYLFSNIVGLNGIFPFGGKGTYQIDSVTWLVTLQSIETLEGLNVGDRVSIGNLIAIDINESRRLIKDYFTIKQIDNNNNTIVVELVNNFPILRVEKDSDKHLIYVSKNVWLTGAFLNGYFKGVWNNGLFKSYPRIGVMNNSEWINGKFDGGRFISNIDSIAFVPRYNTGLIQNFTFFDNNQEPGNRFPKYTSWIDVNFSNSQKTTINQESFLHIEQPLYNSGYTYSFFQDNRVEVAFPPFPLSLIPIVLSGFVTSDVLESTSSFKDIRGISTRYKLGSKYKVYQNLIPNSGNFFEAFSNNRFGLDLSNFIRDGWKWVDWGNDAIGFSGTATPTYSRTTFKGSPIVIESNVDVETQNRLRIKTANFVDSAFFYSSTNQSLNVNKLAKIVLQNTNIDIIRNRYYVTELDLYTYSISKDAWNTANLDAIYPGGTFTFSNSFFGTSQVTLQDLNAINDYRTSPLIKRQFFYNKTGLDLVIESTTSFTRASNFVPVAMTFSTFLDYVTPPTNSFNFVFNNISFLEVDMIPFFNYFGNQNFIDTRIKTPWYAVAPFIDYSDSNFDFIGNVNITIDTDTISNQINYSVISGGVGGSIFPPAGVDDQINGDTGTNFSVL